MPGTPTTKFAWPLPALTDPPDGPAQMAALGNAIDTTVGDRTKAPDGLYAVTFGGFTLGNGVLTVKTRKLANFNYLYIRVNAAAAAPTTAFTGFTNISLPPTAQSAWWATGFAAYFTGAGDLHSGFVYTSSPGFLGLLAHRAADATLGSPAAVWGSGVWPVGAYLMLALTYPTDQAS